MIYLRSQLSVGKRIIAGVLDLFFPPAQICPLCGKDFERSYSLLRICKECLKTIPLLTPPVCTACARPLTLRGNQKSPCSECRREPRFYQRAMAVALYDGKMKEMLHAIKYDFRPELAAAIGSLLAAGVEHHPFLDRIDIIIPVPLHPAKVKTRGYNQAELMAEPVAAVLKRPFSSKALVRTRPTESQSKLKRAERKKNMAGAFAVIDCGAVSGKEILLVDDIRTTGYTLSECARALLLAGAKEVTVLTAAIGVLGAGDSWQR